MQRSLRTNRTNKDSCLIISFQTTSSQLASTSTAFNRITSCVTLQLARLDYLSRDRQSAMSASSQCQRILKHVLVVKRLFDFWKMCTVLSHSRIYSCFLFSKMATNAHSGNQRRPANQSFEKVYSKFILCRCIWIHISPGVSEVEYQKIQLATLGSTVISIVRHSWAVRDNYFEVEQPNLANKSNSLASCSWGRNFDFREPVYSH